MLPRFQRMASTHAKIVIQNANVFDGEQMQSGRTVAFVDGLIVEDATGADTVIDAHGGYLLPGLIDSHAHVHGAEDLSLMAHHGVTTCLDMGTKDLSIFKSLRGGVGSCDIFSAGIPAMPHGSRHTSKPGFPKRLILGSPDDASQFVTDRITDGADFIKVMIEPEGPDQPTVNAIASEAHAQGKLIIAHATTCEAIEKAAEAKVNIITHVPLEGSLSGEVATKMKAAGSVAVPTLIKMLATAATDPASDYAHSRSSVARMKEAGVQILAGTDANKHASGAGKVSYGDSMWQELRLLVEAGLSPAEAIRSATSLPAQLFGLPDRGIIRPGNRADLILLSLNPLENITNVNSLHSVWCRGVEVDVTV